jgi:spermidine synthase
MRRVAVGTLFFFSGAAGLIYEVAWSRSLGVIFGASHLAVTTVLAIYMAGQALGGAVFGARADRTPRPLRLYGALELGVALSALAFLGAMQVYPDLYRSLARVSSESAYLTVVRALFAATVLLVPTTLMGGTLPALSRFVTNASDGVARRVSILYALNTFGAVAGTLAAAFGLLPGFGVTRTIGIAASVSALVGLVAYLVDRREGAAGASVPAPAASVRARVTLSAEVQWLALVGAGVSGFCALGYEVLWTRMLTLVVGTSVYSFAIMLTAFLAGIGLGSQAYALLPLGRRSEIGRGHALLFGFTQLAVGASAGIVTVLMRQLPIASSRVQLAIVDWGHGHFSSRILGAGVLAVLFMVVPAFFMGLAFPAAAAVWSAGRPDPGRALGRLLLSNTVGAILGSVAAGFLLIYVLGIERSLHVLVVLNVAMGAAIAAAVWGRRWALAAVPCVALVLVGARVLFPGFGRVWDQKFFASFSNIGRQVESLEKMREHLNDVEVLYYHEGVNETVSSIRTLGRLQSFIVNGRPEASTFPGDVAVQRALGHLPMLLHPNPRSAFILGTGTGMTLGAVSIHPELQRLVLAEIEEGMLGVARTFRAWNHDVLDSPKLQVVLNDGRNHLATTEERFDVISADPIHPWSGGAGYLYTREYFEIVSRHLAPQGVACQWLPLYELSPRDLRTIVRTWREAFKYASVWITYYDTILVGSNDPIVLDEAGIDHRLAAAPLVKADLDEISMGTAKDLFEHFLMGEEGSRAFAEAGGVVNTDDNLWLEFSAPRSHGDLKAPGRNVAALARYRESLSTQTFRGLDGLAKHARWDPVDETSRLFDVAHARHLLGYPDRDVDPFMSAILARAPDYGPARFLEKEREFHRRSDPAAIAELELPTTDGPLKVVAVRQFVLRERVLVSFVDPARRQIFGQRYLDGSFDSLEQETLGYARTTLDALRAVGPPEGASVRRAALAQAIHDRAAQLVGTIASAR